MTRLPQVGADDGSWGDILNGFLAVEHNTDGTLRTDGSLGGKADEAAVLKKANNLSDLASPASARSNLGLGDAATLNVGTLGGTVAAGDDTRLNGSQVVNIGSLGSAYTLDASIGKDILARGTLNANCTLGTPTGAAAGTTITFELTQDATGGRAVTWFTSLKPGGNLPQSSSAGALDIYTAYTPDGTNWRIFAAGIGMA